MLRLIIISAFIFINNFSSYGKNGLEKIRIHVVLINEVNGEPLTSNFDIKVRTHPDNKEIPVQYAKKRPYYEINRGVTIKIKSSATGFYSDENAFDSSELSDGDYLEIRLSPKPSGMLSIKTVDKETQKAVPANIKIDYFALSDEKITDVENQVASYFYEQQGKYKITTVADGFLNDVREMQLNISKEQLKTDLIIELTRNRMKQEISFYDKSNNGKIANGTAKITHIGTNQVVFEGKITNSMVKFDANRDDKYKLVVKGEGYAELNQDFELTGKILRFGLNTSAAFMIDVYDDATNQRLATQLEIISPSGTKSIIRTSESQSVGFSPKETGSYQVLSKADGYINKSGALVVKAMNAGSTFYTLRLKKGSNEYIISVFDAIDKSPVNNAMVKVFNDKSIEIEGKANKNQKTVNLEEEKKHFFEVSAPGYYDYTANVSDSKKIEVFLKKKIDTLEKTSIAVVDYQTLLKVSDAKVRIFDEKNNPVLVSFSDKEGVFFSDKLKAKQKYTYEVSAKGYNTVKGDVEVNTEPKIIELKPLEINTYAIGFYDKFTKKVINPSTKVLVGGKNIIEDKSGAFNLEMTNANNYTIETTLAGYQNLKKTLDKRELNNGRFEFGIFKEQYQVDFNFDNSPNSTDLNETSLILTNKNNQKKERLSFVGSAFSGQINPESSYLLEIKIPGFRPSSQPFVLSQVDPNTLTYNIKLTPEQKAETKTENKVLVTITKNEETRQTIPNNLKDIKKGVKYPLEGVNFEKSKTSMVPGAEKNLEGLIQYLKENPNTKIEIAGHTDNEGSDQRLNQRLSEFRAKVVANYLFNKGINSARITTKGMGSSEPVVPNDTEENKAKNRRIEILIED